MWTVQEVRQGRRPKLGSLSHFRICPDIIHSTFNVPLDYFSKQKCVSVDNINLFILSVIVSRAFTNNFCGTFILIPNYS